MISLSLTPFVGALPIRFGMERKEVHSVFGTPNASGTDSDSWGKRLEICVGFDGHGRVDHIGLSPGEYELLWNGTRVWTPEHRADPNPILLRDDRSPLERVGFWYFTRLGIATTGFHDGDTSQESASMYPRGAKDSFLARALPANTAAYQS